MSLNNKTVFVAGGSGMAGHAIVKHILQNFPLANIKSTYYSQNAPINRNPMVEYIRVDLRSKKECINAVKDCQYAIMAAATTGGAAQSQREPWVQVNDNMIMNSQMLEAFYLGGVKRVLLIGSATCYQECGGRIKEEDLDLRKDPHNAHFGIGWVTRYLEKLGQFWHEKVGLEVVKVRAANIFGPYAQFNPKNSNFLPALIRKAVSKMDPFEVWGSSENTRDVIFADDFAAACVSLLANEEIRHDVFNVGSGIATSVGSVVETILQYSDFMPSKILYSESMPTNIKQRVLDCTKLRKYLTDLPNFSIEKGLQKTLKWWINNQDTWKK